LEFRDISRVLEATLNILFSNVYCVDTASRSSARGRQTTLRWQKQVFIHTRLSRAYLALSRLSCS